MSPLGPFTQRTMFFFFFFKLNNERERENEDTKAF